MRIAITGIGIVSAIGDNVSETVSNLENEVTGLSPLSPLCHSLSHPILNGLPVGVVKKDNAILCRDLGIEIILPRTVLLGIKAAREALAMSRCTDFAFINGNTVGGMDITEQEYAEWVRGGECHNINFHGVGACTKLIAQHIEGVGYSTTISTACSSALNSIIEAANLIRSGKTQCVLAGGTECLTQFHLLGFQSLGILDKEICRPFDMTRNGINLGEGAAYLVLEDEASARDRGVDILAYLSGYGNACDAFHQTASSPDGEGAMLAMTKALKMAGRKPCEVDYINAHGTSTSDNDRSESMAIKRLFGENYPFVSSTKGFTGHTTSASGSIECVISLVSMLNGFIPANHNWINEDLDCLKPVQHTLRHLCDVVMINAFGFGGNDSSVIIESCQSDVRQLSEMRTVNVSSAAIVHYSDSDDYSKWIKPLEARRLSRQMRLIVAAACQALDESHIQVPDAIVTATSLGSIEYTRLLLDCMTEGDAGTMKPSWFMYSTHNSVSSLLAIKLHCHGNNCTFSNGESSETDARLYAEMLIEQGEADNVLLLCFDEHDTVWNTLMASQNLQHTCKAVAEILKKEQL